MMNIISAFRTCNSLLQLKMQFNVFWSKWIFNQNSSSHKINQEQNSLSLQQNLVLNSTSSSNQKKLNILIQNWILKIRILFQIINSEFKMFLFSFNKLKTSSASEKKRQWNQTFSYVCEKQLLCNIQIFSTTLRRQNYNSISIFDLRCWKSNSVKILWLHWESSMS